MNNLIEDKQEETNWSPEVLDNTRNILRNSSSSSRFDVNFGNTLSYDVKFDTSLSEVNENSKEQSQANNGKEHELVRKSSRQLFNQMGTLFETPNGELEWKQTARWVKFEEKVEDGGERWSKPHVASFSLFSLFDLRSLLLNGTTLFDMDASDLETIVENILEAMISQGKIIYDIKERTKDTLLRKHRRLYEKSKFKKKDSMSNIFSQSLVKAIHKDNATEDNGNVYKGNKHFMKKIPAGSEASNILVGEVNYLEKPIVAFVRLSNPVLLEGITEVPVSSRFIFILLGPKGELNRYREIGRAMAILLSDELFTDIIYEVKNKLELMKAIDDFMEAVTVLPPAGWDPSVRIEPPAKLPSQESRKPNDLQDKVEEEEDEMALRQESGLVRTGRIFGGLINDLKRKKPFYLSDFKDGFSIQSIASICFLYFACLSPIITFGGLLGAATDNNIAAMESLIAGLICGVTYGLASGQPLTILGSTGPVLILETILFNFCKGMEWDYMELRFWVGIWAAGILLILVAADASSFVCYITRFTEENFATLIALIFIFEAIEKVINIGHEYPMETNANEMKYCNCSINNTIFNEENCIENGGQFVGDGCIEYFPDIFTFSILLFFGTFFISTWLKAFKNEPYFGSKIRNFISDFSVIIAILSMTMMDYFVGINTPKLNVPEEFKPTNPHRNWVIQPFGKNPWWTPIAAAIPAALACILLFMDQQITAVIVNRKENKLKKGCGYHLDLFILAILIAVNSVMGLPWFVAATVLSINHVNSLKLESETAAPGEKPQFLGVRENRLTHVVIFLLIGGSVLMTPVLKNIPMSVLFGVFLYMGVAALKGIQFFDRILIMFMPAKYQPDYAFLRQVPLKKIHIYTCVQLTCLVILWVIKSFKQTSILFPLMLVVMIGVRKLLDKFFTQRELKILDDALPEFKRKQKIKAEETNSEKINDKKNWPRFRKKSIINISDDPNKNTTYGVVHNNFLGEINGQYDFKMNTQNGIDNVAFVVDNSSKQDLQSDKKSPQEYDIEAKNEDSTIKF